ncbi:MAG TPA: hypothetical protein PK141_25720 [Polyangiaceae bacterium]|nr:hypothetical protein [Polyangiaceae bacterium]
MMSSPVRSLLAATLVSLAALVSACGSAPAPFALFPSGQSVLLLDAPVHLGDNRAGGQSFPNGTAEAGRICSLVNLPRAAQAYLQVSNVRQSESLGDMVTINGRGISLPMTLERDHAGVTPNATTASPIHAVSLPAGPSEICLVAGMRQCGDLDDFEVDQLALFVQGIDEREISVRRNLTQGRPAPTAPPSVPWGRDQHPYVTASYRSCDQD